MNRKAAISSFAVVVVALAGWMIIGGAADGDRDWPAYGGDKGGTKYSPLDQINRNTIKNLQIAWRRSAVPEELRASFPDAQGPPTTSTRRSSSAV